jgi:DNA-binding IclR family transcriptional regulator
VEANLEWGFAMPRKANQAQLQVLQKAIETHPGKRAGFIARLLNWHREKVNRKLVTLNDRGVLLWEDDHGGLWLFDKKSA